MRTLVEGGGVGSACESAVTAALPSEALSAVFWGVVVEGPQSSAVVSEHCHLLLPLRWLPAAAHSSSL